MTKKTENVKNVKTEQTPKPYSVEDALAKMIAKAQLEKVKQELISKALEAINKNKDAIESTLNELLALEKRAIAFETETAKKADLLFEKLAGLGVDKNTALRWVDDQLAEEEEEETEQE